MNIDDYLSKLSDDLDDQISQLNDSINASLNIGIGEECAPVNQPEAEDISDDTILQQGKTYLLIFEIYADRCYQIPEVPSMERFFSYSSDELEECGISEDDEVTADNLPSIIASFDGAESFGYEFYEEIDNFVHDLGTIEVIEIRDGEKWHDAYLRDPDETYTESDVCFEPAEKIILDEGITIAGPRPMFLNCFTLDLGSDECFDIDKLSVRSEWQDGGVITCDYDGIPLKFVGMGDGDGDHDYFDEVHIYLNGEEIDYEGE